MYAALSLVRIDLQWSAELSVGFRALDAKLVGVNGN